jgi:DNA-binding transcriptional LysR family regulator
VDGQAFLPHARDLLRAEERAAASVRPGRRPLRVDVLGARFAPADLLRGFLRAHPGTALDAVTLRDAAEAVAAVSSGTADATFRAVPMPGSRLPDGVAAVRVLDEPLHLIVGPGHPLAGARAVTPAQLAGHRIWIPGIMPGTEWAAYYADLAAVFGLAIGATDPVLGTQVLVDALAEAPDVATLVGERTRILWPAGHDLRRLPVRDPTPVYPHALVWRDDNPHPALAALRDHLATLPAAPAGPVWAPAWAR